ncbi:MAG: hypothetical protein ABII02_00705 [Candidatus Magasanikbacteria bacterium]
MSTREARAVPPPLPPDAAGKKADIIDIHRAPKDSPPEASLDSLESSIMASLDAQAKKLNEARNRAQIAWKNAVDSGKSDKEANAAMEAYRQALLAGAEEVRVLFNTPSRKVVETLIIPPRKEK